MGGNLLLDFVDADLAAAGPQQVRQKLGGAVDSDFPSNEAGMGGNPGQRPFQFPHIAGNPVSKEFQNLVRNRDARPFGFLLENAKAQFIVGRMNIGDHAPAEARAKALLHPFKIGRGLVGGDDHLPPILDERVEGMEKFLLR